MRYFTKEIYEEMQVRGSLCFHESKEELEGWIKLYENEGRDYYKESLKNFEYMKPFYLKYLPENLLEYVEDKSLMICNIPEITIQNKVNTWNAEWDLKWKSIGEEYNQYYSSISSNITEDIKKLHNSYLIYDATILQFSNEENNVVLLIKTVEEKLIRLIFTGVRKFQYSFELTNNSCLWMEVRLIEQDLFEVQILMNRWLELAELEITFSDLKIIESRG